MNVNKHNDSYAVIMLCAMGSLCNCVAESTESVGMEFSMKWNNRFCLKVVNCMLKYSLKMFFSLNGLESDPKKETTIS